MELFFAGAIRHNATSTDRFSPNQASPRSGEVREGEKNKRERESKRGGRTINTSDSDGAFIQLWGARSCTASLLEHARIFPTLKTELTDHDRAGGTFSHARGLPTPQEPASRPPARRRPRIEVQVQLQACAWRREAQDCSQVGSFAPRIRACTLEQGRLGGLLALPALPPRHANAG